MKELLLASLSGPAIPKLISELRLPETYREQLKGPILNIALWLFRRWEEKDKSCFIAGIAGAQGTGKSTLSLFLKHFLEQLGLRVMILAIDDLYLPRSRRVELAETVHPLFATRGVPGTHEIKLAQSLFKQARTQRSGKITWPCFNKAKDDRDSRHVFEAPVDLLLFEGWCVGCPPLDPKGKTTAINALERKEDPEGIWRDAIQAALLGDYCETFNSLDALMMLKLPRFEQVYQWRRLQEEKLGQSLGPENSQNMRVMNEGELRRFIQHYERLTRHMLDTLPPCADVLIELDEDHQISSARFS